MRSSQEIQREYHEKSYGGLMDARTDAAYKDAIRHAKAAEQAARIRGHAHRVSQILNPGSSSD